MPSRSIYEERIVVQEHFWNTFGGRVLEFCDVVAQHRVKGDKLAMDVNPEHLMPNVRSTRQLRLDNRLNRKKNAPGEDLLVPELICNNSQPVAGLAMPLRLKVSVKISPPIQWRGGMIHELYKGKGSSTSIDSYRDIMLGNVTGKNAMKLVRYTLLPAATSMVGTTQYGAGLNNGDTSKTRIHVKLVCEYAKCAKTSVCVFYTLTSLPALLHF